MESGAEEGNTLFSPFFSVSSFISVFLLAEYICVSVYWESGMCSLQGRVPQDKNGSQGKEVRTGTGNVTVPTIYYLPSAKVSAKCFILSVFFNHTNIPLR